MVKMGEHNCGMLTECCNFCQALHWKSEENSRKRFTKCYHDDKVSLTSLSEVSNILIDLLFSELDEAKNFIQHIRSYNAALAFGSMGAEINFGKRPFCFRIHGQIYQRISSLYSIENNKTICEQLYIFDSSETNAYPVENNKGCLEALMEKLDILFILFYLLSLPSRCMRTNQTGGGKIFFMENPYL